MKQSYPVLKTVMLSALLLIFVLQACKKDKDPEPEPPAPPPVYDLTKEQLNDFTMLMVLHMRNALEYYYDVTGIIGREIYRFSPTEARYTTELLGSGSASIGNTQFYITNPWVARYNVVKEALLIMREAARSTKITDAEMRGFTGVAKTVIAHELLMNLNLTFTNGIYINLNPVTARPDSGAIVLAPAAMDTIARLLNEAKTTLTGSAMPPLPSGFDDYSDAAGFIKINRALAARVAVYRQQWSVALTALNESFLNLSGDLNAGPKHAFAVYRGDILNPCFIKKNETGDVRLAHPAFSADIIPADARIAKTNLRTSLKTQDGLSSNRDVWIYPVNVTSIPIIRNEELILIYAEAKIQLSQIPDGIVSINRIRTSNNLPAYAGGISPAALMSELLHQRRYSLAFEGHYWVDMRRYVKLGLLPVDRPGDDVWEKFPVPAANLTY